MRKLIVDSFAGGGGASTGIEMALGRSPDYAINHDADAIAMHEVNHPETEHLSKNIWQVDPLDVIGRRKVGLAWFSPDCKHFSKAKGGKPVQKNIRDLAWVVVLWAQRVRPDVILLENVEEFRTWGPVLPCGKPCPDNKGATFDKWVRELKRCGYKVEFRELRACDYGAPTIRRRLFMIARCDGKPIVWPEPTHGAPDDPDVISGIKRPWRTAAEIIDWSIPCPSIFDSKQTIWERYGVRAVRPLADNTMRRIARGVAKYVLEAKKPFLISIAHGNSGGRREYPIDDPIGTMTGQGNAHAVVSPVMTFAQHGGSVRSPEQPLHTIAASQKDQNALIAPYMVPRYQEREGQAPRVRSVEDPAATVVPGGNEGVLAAVHMSRFTQNGIGHAVDEPVDTVMPGAPKFGLIAAFMAQHNNHRGTVPSDGRPIGDPLSTITMRGTQQHVVAANLLNLKGSNRRDAPVDEPLRTITSGGGHAALMSGFLTKYYSEGGQWAGADEPLHTDTVKDRQSLVTVDIDGQSFVLTDIGMRMLTPRERFRAQGFLDSYIIDRRPDGSKLTQTVQGSCCGNSVCPPLAEALVAANCGDLAEFREAAE